MLRRGFLFVAIIGAFLFAFLTTNEMWHEEVKILNFASKPCTTTLLHTIPWTILMTVNSAFFNFYQNWLWYYQQLHLPASVPVIVIAEDDELYRNVIGLNSKGIIVKKSDMRSINSSLKFNTPLFKEYMTRRAVYILEYLQEGLNVLHVDVDSVWLKNPLPYLSGDFDIWGQEDHPSKAICIGFVAFKSNEKVKHFVRLWIEYLRSSNYTVADQRAFNKVLRPKLNLRVNKLPSVQFPSGKYYFERFDDTNRSQTVVVHNNWIIGHDAKTKRFKKFNLWKL